MNVTAQVGPPATPADPNYVTFWEFFQAFIKLQGIELPLSVYHKQICDTLMAAFLGVLPPEIQYIVINMPPRTGKTKILEAFACWGEAYFPDSQFIYTSYAGSLVKVSMGYIGQVMMSQWFTSTFGDFVHTKAADKITTTAGGNIHGEGTGGSLTGKGGGLKRAAGGAICIDDPAKPDEAFSPVESEKLKRWLHTTIERRRNSDRWCPIIICAQRLATDDLPGYVMQTYPGKFLLLKFPAMVNGVSVIPDTISTETLEALKTTRYGRFVLAGQYMQEPIALGGNLIQVDSFRRYDPATARSTEWEQLVVTVDTAMKIKESNDFSCAQLWGKKDRRAYLIDQIYGKWESPALLANVIAFSNKCREEYPDAPLRVVVEEKAAGIGLIQQMKIAGVPAEGIERDIDKVRRVQAILPYQESGLVYLPKDDSTPWVAGVITECAEFKPDGTHAHDDRVDCLCDGVTILLGRALSILDLLGDMSK